MDGAGQVQAVFKTTTMVLSNTKQHKEQACTKRYGGFVHVMSELWRRHNGSRMRRGVAVGLTQAETLKPGLLAEGCLATLSEGVTAVYKKQRHSNARRMLLLVAARCRIVLEGCNGYGQANRGIFVYNGGCCEAYRFELLSLALAPC
jgi:hypothetical protein